MLPPLEPVQLTDFGSQPVPEQAHRDPSVCAIFLLLLLI